MTYFQTENNLTSLDSFQLVWDGFVAWGVGFPSHWGQEKMSVSILVKHSSSQPPWDLTALFAEGRAACEGWETREPREWHCHCCWKRRTQVEKARIWLLFADGLFPSGEQRLIVICSHPHPAFISRCTQDGWGCAAPWPPRERHSSEGIFAMRDGVTHREFCLSHPPKKLQSPQLCSEAGNKGR